MKTLYKAEILKLLLKNSDVFSGKNNKEFIEDVFVNIITLFKTELRKGNTVSLLNFGKLVPKKYNKTHFMNPATHIELIKAPRIRVTFVEVPALKIFLNKKKLL